ncbi:MAG: NUDIX domain-containing protein [Gammaproteobacteria bacterium]|jgi:8-oxo-dGTP pyrophosphatase MutT (NUDIX family)|nr:NUDIX domain-containing protein [Gammaproteobacteria bacterium]MBT3721778.1 NUDIX domain-containing protein [Gammaproteobacteria bacterium]MBT4078483.1 NUDIX domain-containing protein [Gammaproteobacteria bacterium]MBT4196114.1 NUDIX domain-containing protein [Gammaproteobacteria bacterium]MBT4450098.1 NUDIX domain-containing protein [Gammaproteobacteria bacterium]
MGAGVIPLSVKNGQVQFLFQHTFSGRKAGYFIDFGGGLGKNEGYRETAIREFVEETETMYLTDELQLACLSDELVTRQIIDVEKMFERTLSEHPHWWCQRKPGKSVPPKDWRTYFIEFPFRDISLMNHEWKSSTTGRFKKRRELVWVSADDLLDIYASTPDKLWKRVRQLENAATLIREIKITLRHI